MKYKLIKWYPSLPEDWAKGMEVGQGDRNAIRANFSPCSIFYSDVYLKYEEIVNNPEFWEKVEEKDYEILSFICTDKKGCCNINTILYKDSDGIFWGKGGYEWDDKKMLTLNHFQIHSIKRLSDGEIFSIGDLCNPISVNTNKQKISKIEFCKVGYLRIESSNYYVGIDNIEHSKKQPLFTTEDGIDIEDEKYVIYGVNFKFGKTSLQLKDIESFEKNEGFLDWKYFSNLQTRNKYIEENKPKYSEKDMLDFALWVKMNNSRNLKQRQEDLVEWKLKNNK